MSEDLIRRSDAIEVTWQEPSYTDAINALTEVRERIKDIPSAEKQGEWEIEKTESVWGKGYLLTCSVCGDTFRVTENAFPYEKYCRNCGAKMKGADDDN